MGFAEPAHEHGAWEYEPSTGTMRWSDAIYRMHGVDRDEFEPSAQTIPSLVHPDDRGTYGELLDDAASSEAPFACQFRVVRPDGEVRILTMRGSFVEGQDGAPDRLIGTTQDVTRREGEEERLWHLANHDSVSGLYNRRRFMEELEREVARSSRSQEPGSVLVLDLDHFKDFNDSLGHMAGDTLLGRVGSELKARLRTTDTIARTGGDEFAVALPGCTGDTAERLAESILSGLVQNVSADVGGVRKDVTGSIGVTSFEPGADGTAESLLAEAESAMLRAKANGRGRVVVFDEGMRADLEARSSTEGELREAITDELRVHFQPIVSISDGAVVGCEALVRWEHPERGLVGASDFVSIADEAGLIAKIARFVFARACHQAVEWRREGRELFVSVNVSPLQLTRSDVVADVSRALASSGLPPHLLCIEISEASVMRDTRPLLSTLSRLKALGVRIAIDDFGAGASSLGVLRLLPLDQIKIDRHFVHGLADNPNDRSIVSALVALAGELDLTVIAEGVETARQQEELRALGASLAQGFLYSAAKDPAELDLRGFAATVAPT